jgi:hypothetical protein
MAFIPSRGGRNDWVENITTPHKPGHHEQLTSIKSF